MTFETWLRKQKYRDDPVGDLAKDFIDAYRIILKEKNKRAKIKDTFSKFNPCSDAMNAYHEAQREYHDYRK